MKKDFAFFMESLESNPLQGIALGNNCFKVRLLISSKKTGKSGGARVITYVRIIDEQVVLISIYDKSEKSNITDAEIKSRLKKYLSK